MYRYVYYKTGNRWDTDDLVSEIFRKSYEKFATLKDHSNPKAWLMTIARNTVIDFYRRKKEVASGMNVERPEAYDAFEGQWEHDDEIDCLKKALAVLPQEDQEIINMRYFAEMKFRDIGAAVEKTENAIRVRASRLLKKLGTLIGICLKGVRKDE